MNDDDLKKRLERLGDNNARDDSSNPSDKDKLTIEKIIQVLMDTRREARENRKATHREIADLQAKIERQKGQIRNLESTVLAQKNQLDAYRKENIQLHQRIQQATSRKWRFWPFGGSRSC
jgi:septal ring factor EnvC (AmiA/AmiB activator)